MTYRCKSTIRVYEIGAEDRIYEAISSSSHSGAAVRQISGTAFDIEVLDTRSALSGTNPARHAVEHLVVGLEQTGDPAKLEAFLEQGIPGQRRYAVTDYATFGESVVPGD